MKNILVSYISYNRWANQQLLKVLLKLKPGQPDAEWGGVQPTIRQLVGRLWVFEYEWHQRLLLVEKVADPFAGFQGSFEDLCRHCLEQSVLLETWVANATQARLNHTIAYTLKKNEHFKTAVEEVLLEIGSGSAMIRGQLVSLLRQLGVAKLPAMDYRSFKPKK